MTPQEAANSKPIVEMPRPSLQQAIGAYNEQLEVFNAQCDATTEVIAKVVDADAKAALKSLRDLVVQSANTMARALEALSAGTGPRGGGQ